MSKALLLALGLVLPVTAQVARDSGVAGPPIELVHLYNDEFPTGMLFLLLAATQNFSPLNSESIHIDVVVL